MKKIFQKFRVKPPSSTVVIESPDYVSAALAKRDEVVNNINKLMEPMDWLELVAYRDEFLDAIAASEGQPINRIYRFNLSVVEYEMSRRIESC